MRYVFGFLLAVALVIVVFILIIRGFSGSDEPAAQTQLVDYAKTETVMRMTVDGPVNADQEHRSANVTIGRTINVVNLVQGYDGTVIDTRSYNSNEDAYATFLRALQLQDYNEGNSDPDDQDSRGVCPTGRVYTFEIVTGSSVVQSFWTSSCGGGTFRGNTNLVRQLFRAQIPDYNDVVRGQGLN